jgi:cellulose synthase/poly-beta-1,6-N-acetylglucosamine synthase-like glycosyltransferase
MIGPMLVFLINPLYISLMFLIWGRKPVHTASIYPSVSIINVMRNAEDIVVDKIHNTLSLAYPLEKLEIILYSDGSTDRTEDKVKPFLSDSIHLFSSPIHEGKISGINTAVQESSGEILFFSDIDAMLEKDAILKLVKYFADPNVGGVCGKQIIYKSKKGIEEAQRDYKRFDTSIKQLESLIGSISSNDGTLYAIRRKLFKPIPPAVTDDLYVCLSIVKQHYRFLFEPEARAFIKGSARTVPQEIQRRRRIISTSLRGIYLMRELLNPFMYGSFSIRLIINKIIRRLLPLFLITLFLSSILLSQRSSVIEVFLYLQIIFYLIAFLYGSLLQHLPPYGSGLRQLGIINRIPSLAFYFCLGNYGMFLGVIDFLRGREITKWEPVKAD